MTSNELTSELEKNKDKTIIKKLTRKNIQAMHRKRGERIKYTKRVTQDLVKLVEEPLYTRSTRQGQNIKNSLRKIKNKTNANMEGDDSHPEAESSP